MQIPGWKTSLCNASCKQLLRPPFSFSGLFLPVAGKRKRRTVSTTLFHHSIFCSGEVGFPGGADAIFKLPGDNVRAECSRLSKAGRQCWYQGKIVRWRHEF